MNYTWYSLLKFKAQVKETATVSICSSTTYPIIVVCVPFIQANAKITKIDPSKAEVRTTCMLFVCFMYKYWYVAICSVVPVAEMTPDWAPKSVFHHEVITYVLMTAIGTFYCYTQSSYMCIL